MPPVAQCCPKAERLCFEAVDFPWGYLNSVQPREKPVSLGADAFGASQDHALRVLAA
jgi:hypothetical protein